MRKSSRRKLGFSLLEISIVITIIGILVISISEGSIIAEKSRLRAADSLTTNSPVASIEDLLFWLETTSKNSFDSTVVDGSTVSTWYDISPHNPTKHNFINGGNATYVKSGLNSLPTLSFNGTSNYLENTSAANYFSINNSFSVFVVFKVNSLPAATLNQIFGSKLASGNADQWSLTTYGSTIRCGMYNGSSYFTTKSLDTFTNISSYVVASVIYDVPPSSTGTVSLYINGVQAPGTSGGNTGGGSIGYLTIGKRPNDATGYLNGYVGEVIAFSRSLSDYERTGVERYLSKKWNVRI